MKRNKLNKKQQKQLRRVFRGGIQLIFFLLYPAVFTTAFSGIKYLFTQMGNSSVIEFNSFLQVLVGICLFTIIFGRFFCGYACAFGSLGDLLYGISSFIQKKIKKKLPEIPDKAVYMLFYGKYIVLGVICLLCFLGVYGNLQGSSPWDVFSMLSAFRLSLSGYQVGFVILLIIMVGMCLEERFFCKFLCPMGAGFAMLPILPWSLLRRDRDNCAPKCIACRKQCPVHLEIDGDSERSGECLQCNKCLDICPKGNIHTGYGKIKGNEYIFVVVKTAVLLTLCYFLKV